MLRDRVGGVGSDQRWKRGEGSGAEEAQGAKPLGYQEAHRRHIGTFCLKVRLFKNMNNKCFFSAKLVYFIQNSPLPLRYTHLHDLVAFQMRILGRWPAWLWECWYTPFEWPKRQHNACPSLANEVIRTDNRRTEPDQANIGNGWPLKCNFWLKNRWWLSIDETAHYRATNVYSLPHDILAERDEYDATTASKHQDKMAR